MAVVKGDWVRVAGMGLGNLEGEVTEVRGDKVVLAESRLGKVTVPAWRTRVATRPQTGTHA